MLALVWRFLELCKKRMASTGKERKQIINWSYCSPVFIRSDTVILLSKRCNGYIGIIYECEAVGEVWQDNGSHAGIRIEP